jgi:phosphoribosyl 1,2-cyclic phosphate phosphodiesterase
MQLTFLGTGAAGGVPLWGCECGVCTLARIDVSFIRRPNCALVEAGEVSLLLDAGVMDVGERFPPGTLSAILVTHFHADHVQGLFHLRWGQGELDVYTPHDAEGCADLYKSPGPLKFKHLSKFEPFDVGDVKITPVPLVHSKPTLGYCIEHAGARLAYLSDCSGLPAATASFLDEWKPHSICLDCTYPPGTAGPSNHFDLLEALVLCQNYPDSEISLMHVGHRLDEWLMQNPGSLPERVKLARDNEIRIIIGTP